MDRPVIGVVGGGQLARMMAPPATELGLDLRVLATSADECAVAAVHRFELGDHRDLDALRRFAADVDVLTFDHEHVPTEHLRTLIAEGVAVHPGPDALVHAQDKLVMRAAVDRLGLPNPAWAAVDDVDALVAFGETTGWPVILKTPRGGYDGKGVRVIEDADAARAAADWFSDSSGAGGPLLAEQKVPFSRELSALLARTPSGAIASWPVVESIQVAGVCDEVIAPAPGLDPAVAAAATDAAQRLAAELGVTGVLAVELFETPGVGPGFAVNELAMRPHNSGHWTMDGSVTGQFEQHLRAVLDLPLGATDVVGAAAVMKNVLGGANPDLFAVYPQVMADAPAVKVHTYGKGVRPGRKIGHVNVVAPTAADLPAVREAAEEAARTLADGPTGDRDSRADAVTAGGAR
ncbi:N5-carboxyaminoimidazole ribonucleotide synthase [Tersicoccus solisilvae]|uniref:N5-carboxyaminoimidazole ribonucleotide synthase n=1 Tax=Tersicoccus solisilvae TaxID=1882339 RepID=A0ABQ1P9E0_9MICC|nr:5-(carboxyamino)imidazole ribonucleotide synthase [Tersicoccus solisilvae]GGC92663.1 N5-carboxyaminoimidazole ribonucleotide synthase [Tersicoccus solisilvae]